MKSKAIVFESEDLLTTLSQKISLVTIRLAAPRGQVPLRQLPPTEIRTDVPPVAKPRPLP